MLKQFSYTVVALGIVACASTAAWEVSRQIQPEPLFAYTESQVSANGLMLNDSVISYAAYRVVNAVTPNNWQVAFSTDRAALSAIDWDSGELWTDVLKRWGEENRLNIMLDGANRIAVVSNEQARREPGIQWVNSNNALHKEMYAPEYRFNEYKKYYIDRASSYLNMPADALGDMNSIQARIFMLLSAEQLNAPKPMELGPYQPSAQDKHIETSSASGVDAEQDSEIIATAPEYTEARDVDIQTPESADIELAVIPDSSSDEESEPASEVAASEDKEKARMLAHDEQQRAQENMELIAAREEARIEAERIRAKKDMELIAARQEAQAYAEQVSGKIESLEEALKTLMNELTAAQTANAMDVEARRQREAEKAHELESALLQARREHAAQLARIQEHEEQRLLIAREEAMAARQQRLSLENEARENDDALRREREARAAEEYRSAQAELAAQIREEAEARRRAREEQILAEREERERYMALREEFVQQGVIRQFTVGDVGTTMQSGSLQDQINSILLDAKLVDEQSQIFWEFGRGYRWPREIELRRGDIDELLTTIMTPFGLKITFTMNGLAIISQN